MIRINRGTTGTRMLTLLTAMSLFIPAGAIMAQQAAVANLSLEARVLGTDGQPVKKSSILFFKAVDEQKDPNFPFWHDSVSGKTWQVFGGSAAGSGMTESRLSPGEYRITARFSHYSRGPIGLSEPIVLDGSQPHTVVTVRLVEGPTLTVRVIDAASGEPVVRPRARLRRRDGVLPKSWIFRYKPKSNPIIYESLLPGSYWLEVYRRAGCPGDMDFVSEEGRVEVEIEAGKDREITVKMHKSPLDQAEVERRWPWVVTGAVTDEQGRPLQGVEVRVNWGMGTLFRGGATTTDADGRYVLRFAGSRGVACAVIRASKSGLFEKNLNRQGNLIMSGKPSEEGNSWFGNQGNMLLPDKPRRIDFVMAPTASIHGELLDSQGKPMGGRYLHTKGAEMPPASGVLASNKTDANGAFEVRNVPPGRSWWFTIPKDKNRRDICSQPIALPGPGKYRVTMRLTSDDDGQNDRLEIFRATDEVGTEILEKILVDDPLAGPPVSAELQVKGREILCKAVQANTYWLGPPPVAVRSYQYRVNYRDAPPKDYQVTDPAKVSDTVRYGIGYRSAIHCLTTAGGRRVTFHRVAVDDRKIELVYNHRNALQTVFGNRELDPKRGLLNMTIGNGKLVLDAKTYALLEHSSGNLRETLSQHVDLGDGRYVPLAVRIQHDQTVFEWKFRVYEPGLWLFHSGHMLLEEGGKPRFAASVDNVRINGQQARVMYQPKVPQATEAENSLAE